MERIKSFIWLTLLGGFTVVLPIGILLLLTRWLYGAVSSMVEPVTQWLAPLLGWPLPLVNGLVLLAMLALCCLIGLFVKTRVGAWVHRQTERLLKRIAPGYKTISDLVTQFFGGGSSSSLLSGEVALAHLYGKASPVTVTVIVTARHDNGFFSVFMPTAPIPTSGVIYHLPADCIELQPHISVETAMKTVIACGAGSQIFTASLPR